MHIQWQLINASALLPIELSGWLPVIFGEQTPPTEQPVAELSSKATLVLGRKPYAYLYV